jgi:serine/threonine protein phosphatase PrpC
MEVNVTVVARTEIGLVRPSNEDAFVVADLTVGSRLDPRRVGRVDVGERGVLLAVSDGTGGNRAGEVASALVVESLCRSMAEPSDGTDGAILEEAAHRANRELWQAAQLPGRERMGATLTAVFIHDRTAHIAEVGDSRAYLVRNGKIEQVTRDQSCVQIMVESGALSPRDATRSRFSSVILQAMGLEDSVQVAVERLELRQGDCFVLCSDGLSILVSADEIRRIVLEGGLDSVCGALVELAKERGGHDDITVIVARVTGDLPPLVAGESISDTLLKVHEFEPGLAPHGRLAPHPAYERCTG